MPRKRRKAGAVPPSRPARRIPIFLALAVLAVSLALGYFLWSEEPQIPDPDRSSMEPQVAAKIEEARGAVLAAPESHEIPLHRAADPRERMK